MTHLLIPIADIEDKLQKAEEEYNQFKNVSHSLHIETLAANIETLKWLLLLGKQISLTDEDIEAKAAKFAIDNTGFYKKYDGMSLHTGYKQALKDLK